jgi:GntR family transcriptional regulator
MKISRTNVSDEVSNWLKEAIRTGQYKSGDRLPSVEQLASDLDVGRSSVREALRQLQALGLVTLRHGKGTFISAPKLQIGSSLVSFSESVRERGMVPGGVILRKEVIPAPKDVADDLQLEEDEPVNLLIRLRLADGEPVAIETSHTPNRRFPELLEGPWTVDSSLYETLASRYGLQFLYALHIIHPILIDEGHSQLLQLPVGTPAIQLKSILYAQDNTPIESAIDIYHPDRYQYTVVLRR